MPIRYRILPYRQESRSARALADALPGGRVLRLEGSTFVPRWNDVIINWGRTDHYQNNVWNQPAAVRNASNKLMFFQAMPEGLTPRFWTNPEEIPDEAFPVVCRTVLAGYGGAGIVIAANRGELVRAPLYVKYIKKQEEYRVHVGKQLDQSITIIAAQRKARRNGFDNPNWQVRNHDNGFVFVRGGVNPPPSVLVNAQEAIGAARLDFGAVDVIWNQHRERAYVLEINTAPGLEGQTIQDYASFFRAYSDERGALRTLH